jgi:hypothetical protein
VDRAYLTRLAAEDTSATSADAERRVGVAITAATNSGAQASQQRRDTEFLHSAVIIGRERGRLVRRRGRRAPGRGSSTLELAVAESSCRQRQPLSDQPRPVEKPKAPLLRLPPRAAAPDPSCSATRTLLTF